MTKNTLIKVFAATVLVAAIPLFFFQNCQQQIYNKLNSSSIGAIPLQPSPGDPSISSDPYAAILTNFSNQIKPIVETKCIKCHQAAGIASFFPMTSAFDLALREVGAYGQGKDNIHAVTNQIFSADPSIPSLMPPYDALSGADCSNPEYSNDHSLSVEQKGLVRNWLNSVAPYSDLLRQKNNSITQKLSALNLALPLQESLSESDPSVKVLTARSFDFATGWGAQLADGSHCPSMSDCYIKTQDLSLNNSSEVYLTSYQVVPENPSLVHHIILYEEGGMGKPYLAWAPGINVERFPNNTGIRIPPNTRFYLEIHYNQSSAAVKADRGTKIRFKLASTIPYPLDIQFMGHNDGSTMTINSETDTVINKSSGLSGLTVPITAPGFLAVVFPHMHKYGNKISMKLRKANGTTQCLVNIPRWRFAWQLNYFFKDAIPVQAGDQIEIECRYKNPNPGTKIVNFGENSEDEMCFGGFMYSRENPTAQAASPPSASITPTPMPSTGGQCATNESLNSSLSPALCEKICLIKWAGSAAAVQIKRFGQLTNGVFGFNNCAGVARWSETVTGEKVYPDSLPYRNCNFYAMVAGQVHTCQSQ